MFYNGARNSGRILEPVPMTPEEIKQGNARQAMIKMYFHQLFDLRRKEPGRRPDHAIAARRGSRRQAQQ